MNPESIDTEAPVVARHSTVIAAPLSVVWQLHADVDTWPTWQHEIDDAHLDGPFAVGATFAWRTHDLSIDSTVYRVEPERRTLWGGPTEGITGIHAWTFTPVPGGVRVDTEESWSGEPVEAATDDMQAGLDAALVAWLAHLAAAAERRVHTRDHAVVRHRG
jgi:hypothetical protein